LKSEDFNSRINASCLFLYELCDSRVDRSKLLNPSLEPFYNYCIDSRWTLFFDQMREKMAMPMQKSITDDAP